MALHPFDSRKKRLENALTVAALYVAVVGIFLGMAYAGGGPDWRELLADYLIILALVPAGIVALVTYVRRGAKQ